MKYKWGFIFICLIISLFTIASVCASEVNETVAVSEDQSDDVINVENHDVNDIGSAKETISDVVSVDNDNQVIAQGNESDIGCFSDLETEINNVEEGGVLNLTRDYKYVSGSTEGISINKAMTIDGQGHTLDGNHLSRILYINGNNAGIKLKNLNFVNGEYPNYIDGGGAICVKGNGIIESIYNCTFINNSATEGGCGGAIFTQYDYSIEIINNCTFINNIANCNGGATCGCSVVNCTFINNSAQEWGCGGAIYNGSAVNCTFINNFAFSGGGAVYLSDVNGIIDNCIFINNSAQLSGGGAVYLSDVNGIIDNCIFINNTAYYEGSGGAIHGGSAVNCTFINNSVHEWDGGAISWGSAVNCTFINNFAMESGGAIDHGSAVNCTFINNSADKGGAISESSTVNCTFINNSANEGGAICVTGAIESISNCNFINCSSKDSNGGAIHISSSNVNVLNCYFDNCNNRKNGGAIYWNGDSGVLINSTFINSYAGVKGSAIYWEGHDGLIENCEFINNSQQGNVIVFVDSLNCIMNNSYFSSDFNNIAISNSQVNIIKKNPIIYCENISFDYGNVSPFNILLKYDNDNLTDKDIIINLVKDAESYTFNYKTNSEGLITLKDELDGIGSGLWNVNVVFEGTDTYSSYDTAATIIIIPLNSSVTVDDVNASWDSQTTFTAHVLSNNASINEGTVSFYIDDEFIGDAPVNAGVASLTHETPGNLEEHIITAIFSSNNYLRSNGTAKLLMNSGDIDVSQYGNVATFKELSKLIENTPEGGVLNLTKDYIYVSGSNEGILINNAITIDGQGHTLDGNQLSRIFNINHNNVSLRNIVFVNGKYHEQGGAIFWIGNNSSIFNCSFINNNAYYDKYESSEGGAIFIESDNSLINSCIFERNSASEGSAIYAIWNNAEVFKCNFTSNFKDNGPGTLYSNGNNNNFSYCNFLNNSAGNGAGLYLEVNENNFVNNCSFINNTVSCSGGALNIGNGIYGIVCNCIFINNTAINNLHSAYGGAVYLGGSESYSITNSYFYENYATSYAQVIYLIDDKDVNIFNCTFKNNVNENYKGIICSDLSSVNIKDNFFYPEQNSIVKRSNSIINFTKHELNIICNDTVFNYNNLSNFTVLLESKNNEYLIKKPIKFEIINYSQFYKFTDENRICYLFDELIDLNVGIWNVTVIFEGNDNYNPCNATATITINPLNSSLTIDCNNTVVGLETLVIANITCDNLKINEGSVTFFDGETNIGEANVIDGVATLTYTPKFAGEHNVTAIFSSTNYLSSNSTAKLLVDSATVDVLVDQGIVGFNSTFAAEVKGLYSTINEGTVTFYINDEYLGSVPVENGTASISYIPSNVNTYTVKVVFGDSDKFLSDEDSVSYVVAQADSDVVINDMNGTVGHDITITVNLVSSNNLTINEGYVIFFDGQTQIGESPVYDGVATLTYTPTTAGEHAITAMFYSTNYGDPINSALLNVSKAEIDLNIGYIDTVYFSNPSNFPVNVLSNSKGVNEGNIKYYVNGKYIGMSNVYDGQSSLSYVTNTTGSFKLLVVYNETDNYFVKNASTTFYVNQMPTTLTGESVIFDEQQYKTFTTELKDNNANGVYNQTVRIELIKYSGESATFTGVSDGNGITFYDVGTLAGGMWYVAGTYNGNENYIGSNFADKFIVVRLDTTTEIEEIQNAQVNHNYKLKANIHDENGKLVKEGILQFYLDGVDIGSIDLSNNQGHQSALGNGVLGAVNPMFEYELGADASELYLNYVPTKAGKHTLTAVYEGTTIYKASNSTTTFEVADSNTKGTEIDAADVSTVYNGGKYILITLKDANGNAISGVKVTVKFSNGKTVTSSATDKNGQVKVSTNGLAPKTYTAIITFAGNTNFAKSTKLVKITVKKATPKLTAKAKTFKKSVKTKKYAVTLKDNTGKVMKKVKLTLKIKGKTYKATTNTKGKATFKITKFTKKGTYTATITFKGNKNYKAATKKVKIKIK